VAAAPRPSSRGSGSPALNAAVTGQAARGRYRAGRPTPPRARTGTVGLRQDPDHGRDERSDHDGVGDEDEHEAEHDRRIALGETIAARGDHGCAARRRRRPPIVEQRLAGVVVNGRDARHICSPGMVPTPLCGVRDIRRDDCGEARSASYPSSDATTSSSKSTAARRERLPVSRAREGGRARGPTQHRQSRFRNRGRDPVQSGRRASVSPSSSVSARPSEYAAA